MKKPLLAALGVAGACAACCALPLALPLLSALGATGLLGWGWAQDMNVLAAIGAALLIAAAFSIGAALRARRLRAAASCKADAQAPACGTQCGCNPAG